MKRNYFLVLLVLLTFFVISFLTNILGPIIPAANQSFNLSLALSGFLPLSFFIAYGPTSIPAGYLTERYGAKKVMILGFFAMTLGCVLFVFSPSFLSYLLSLFIMGIGMAMLQVVINPLLRTAGGEENFAFFSVMAQLVFGAASYVSPSVYSYLMTNVPDANVGFSGFLASVVPNDMIWASFYWLCLGIAVVMIIVLIISKFPTVTLQEDERVEGFSLVVELFKNRIVKIFFLGIFAYVGIEQGVSVWIAKFLETYHNLDPNVEGADTTGLFWGMQAVGGILGLLLMKLFDVRKVLGVFVVAASAALVFALFGTVQTVLWAFPAVGFFTSVMYPSVFSLGLNSLPKHHGTFSGILCTGIIGGAILPFLVGWLGDFVGLKMGMTLVFVALFYLLWIALTAKPLVKNKTIFSN